MVAVSLRLLRRRHFEGTKSACLADPAGDQRNGSAGSVYPAGGLAAGPVRLGQLGRDRGGGSGDYLRCGWAAKFPESHGTNDERQKAGAAACFL